MCLGGGGGGFMLKECQSSSRDLLFDTMPRASVGVDEKSGCVCLQTS